MKILLIIIAILASTFVFGQGNRELIEWSSKPCDSVHHYYSMTMVTYPPCYHCTCGKHLRFDSMTFMALKEKYKDKVDSIVMQYMEDGTLAKKKPIMDSIEIELLAGEKHRKWMEDLRYGFEEFKKKQKQ